MTSQANGLDPGPAPAVGVEQAEQGPLARHVIPAPSACCAIVLHPHPPTGRAGAVDH